MGKKANNAVVRQRVEEVFRQRLGGAGFADVRQFASAPEQQWGVSDRQLWRYIAAADALMAERFDAKAPHLLAKHLLQRGQLYAHAMGAGDFATALRVLQDEARLEGLYPPQKVAPVMPDGSEPWAPWAPVLADLTDGELQLLAKLAERGRQVAAGDAGARGN